jgi:hypothetical protein
MSRNPQQRDGGPGREKPMNIGLFDEDARNRLALF